MRFIVYLSILSILLISFASGEAFYGLSEEQIEDRIQELATEDPEGYEKYLVSKNADKKEQKDEDTKNIILGLILCLVIIIGGIYISYHAWYNSGRGRI